MTRLPKELLWIEPLTPKFPSSCNSFAIWEEDGSWTWIDPGAAGDDNLARTRQELDRLDLPLDKLGRIIITHPHVDHVAAAGMVVQWGFEVPILCHPDAVAIAADIDALIRTFDFDLAAARFVDAEAYANGYVTVAKQRIFRGGAPFVATTLTPALESNATLTTGPFEWTCLLASGHCPGHLVFYCAEHRMLISGDMVGHTLSWHSPSSGGATGYLESLARLDDLDIELVLPAHGSPSNDADAMIGKMRSRLLEREAKLLDALAGGSTPYATLYDQVTNDAGKKRLFPYVPIIEGHLNRLKALGQIIEGAPGMFSRV